MAASGAKKRRKGLSCGDQRKSCTCSYLSPGSEHPAGVEQVDVVAADVILGHADDGQRQGGLSVVVGGIVGDVAGQVAHLRA